MRGVLEFRTGREKREELRVGRNERTLCKEGATGNPQFHRSSGANRFSHRPGAPEKSVALSNSGARAGRCCAGIGRLGAQGFAPTRRNAKDSRAFGFGRPRQNILPWQVDRRSYAHYDVNEKAVASGRRRVDEQAGPILGRNAAPGDTRSSRAPFLWVPACSDIHPWNGSIA